MVGPFRRSAKVEMLAMMARRLLGSLGDWIDSTDLTNLTDLMDMAVEILNAGPAINPYRVYHMWLDWL